MNFFNQLGDFFSNVGEQATYYSLKLRSEVLEQEGKFDEAIELAEQSLHLAIKIWGNENINLATTLNNLGLIYQIKGYYIETEKLFREALKIRENLLGNNHPDVAQILNNLAELYHDVGNYAEAEFFYRKSLNIYQNQVPVDAIKIGKILNSIGTLYADKGRYKDSEIILRESLKISQSFFDEDHPSIAAILNNLATLFLNQGRDKDAEHFLIKALEIRKRCFGNHPSVATLLNNLAQLYVFQKYQLKAEYFYQESLAMFQALLGNHLMVVDVLNNLAIFYSYYENYEKAEDYYKQSLCVFKKLLKNNHVQKHHPSLADILNGLGFIYHSQGKYAEAEPWYKQGLDIRKSLENNDAITVSLNNLAQLYTDQERYTEAEIFYQQALDIKEKCLFDQQQILEVILNNNLGIFYYYQKQYNEAEQFLKKALLNSKKLFNVDDWKRRIFTRLSLVYTSTNRSTLALNLLKEATEVEHRLMSQEFVGSSENDRMRFLDNIRTTQYALLSLVYQYFYPLEESEEKSQAIHTALDLVLKRKALSNAASAAFNAAMYSDRYPQLKDDFQTWRERWQQIINLQSSLYLPENFPRLEANKELLNQLYIEVETLEKNITAEVPELRLENQLVDRTAIALELPANSTLIEFAYFPLYDFTTQQYQNPRYLAFILPAKQPDKVQMIDLGEADKIDDLIGKVRQACSQINLENMGPSWKKEKPKPEPQNPFVELTTAIFKPLQNYLQGQQLFICPDGALTLIPFQILPLNSQTNQLLIDQYQITYLTAGRDLLRYKYQPNRTASEALVIADPNFDLSVNEAVASANAISQKGLSINLNSLREKIRETLGTEAQKPFSPVPMTREIAEAVAAQFKVNPLLQNDALKTYLTNGKCPHKLVLATHGFFLPQNDPPQPPLIRGEFIEPGFRFRQIETTENPLLRSGLALAGANTWLLGGEIPPEAAEGIVFAQDVAGFDLWANELIILIACETAVGDVKIGEGVKGLRSAFTAAGARVLIMSLWSVPAQVSIILMNRFFVNLNQEKLSCQKALQEAQNYIRTMSRKELESLPTGEQIIQQIRTVWRGKYPELLAQWEAQTYPLQARYFWGAWVCVGS